MSFEFKKRRGRLIYSLFKWQISKQVHSKQFQTLSLMNSHEPLETKNTVFLLVQLQHFILYRGSSAYAVF